MRYIWTEDTGAGLHFWNLVNQILFDNKIVIVSKASNQGILDALADLKELKLEEIFIYNILYFLHNGNSETR
ncbi:hypothetical protein [Blautia faecis]|uniref:hypothetical protein n=1 Tax=Blautia faecis TaxID=871665 RepID=UPI0022DF2F53|nr:hypothetical protein [Blautia faecis]